MPVTERLVVVSIVVNAAWGASSLWDRFFTELETGAHRFHTTAQVGEGFLLTGALAAVSIVALLARRRQTWVFVLLSLPAITGNLALLSLIGSAALSLPPSANLFALALPTAATSLTPITLAIALYARGSLSAA